MRHPIVEFAIIIAIIGFLSFLMNPIFTGSEMVDTPKMKVQNEKN